MLEKYYTIEQYYNLGVVTEDNSLIFHLRRYLKGTSLARQAVNRMLASILTGMDGLVLDIGGSGNFEQFIPKKHHVIIDSRYHPRNHLTIDAARMPFDANSFDCVLCISVLEHTIEPLAILKACFRVLRPDGICLVSTPWMFETHMEPEDYWRFSSSQLEKWFTECGFKIIKKSAVNDWWGLLAHLMQKRKITKYTIGLALAAIHFLRKDIEHNPYATTLNYCLRKSAP